MTSVRTVALTGALGVAAGPPLALVLIAAVDAPRRPPAPPHVEPPHVEPIPAVRDAPAPFGKRRAAVVAPSSASLPSGLEYDPILTIDQDGTVRSTVLDAYAVRDHAIDVSIAEDVRLSDGTAVDGTAICKALTKAEVVIGGCAPDGRRACIRMKSPSLDALSVPFDVDGYGTGPYTCVGTDVVRCTAVVGSPRHRPEYDEIRIVFSSGLVGQRFGVVEFDRDSDAFRDPDVRIGVGRDLPRGEICDRFALDAVPFWHVGISPGSLDYVVPHGASVTVVADPSLPNAEEMATYLADRLTEMGFNAHGWPLSSDAWRKCRARGTCGEAVVVEHDSDAEPDQAEYAFLYERHPRVDTSEDPFARTFDEPIWSW